MLDFRDRKFVLEKRERSMEDLNVWTETGVFNLIDEKGPLKAPKQREDLMKRNLGRLF